MGTPLGFALAGVVLAAWAAVADRAAGMTWAATGLDCVVGLAFVAVAAFSGLRVLPKLGLASVGFAWLVASPLEAATSVHRGLLVAALLVWSAPWRTGVRQQILLHVVALAAAVGLGGQPGAAGLLIVAAVVVLLRADVPIGQRWPLAAAVGFVGAVLAGSWVLSRTDPQRFHPEAAITAYEAALLITAVAVVAVRRRHQSGHERALQDALASVSDGGMAGFVELLRRSVGDPTLDVVVGTPDRATGTEPTVKSKGTLTVLADDGTPLCLVVHRSSTLADPVTAARVAAATKLAVEHARLADELAQQLAEVEASRARLLTATDLERATAATELHNTVGPLLVKAQTAIEAGLVGSVDRAGSVEPARAAARELSATAVELEGLVAGVAPFPLGGGRLVEAVQALSAGAPLPVVVRTVGDVRADPSGEAALYFACSEALANAYKHSRATRVSVTLRPLKNVVQAEVRDDGVGRADPSGAGLTALADRLAACGGRLQVASGGARGGTVVTASVPARAFIGSSSTV